MESDGPGTGEVKAAGSRGDNVVPFPRDWLGPHEELVPFGSDPALEQDPGTRSDRNAAGRPTGASDFWDESSWAVQSPVEAPPLDRAAGDDAGFDWDSPDGWDGGSRVSRFTRAREIGAGQFVVIGAVALALVAFVVSHLGGTLAGRQEANLRSAGSGQHGGGVPGGPRSPSSTLPAPRHRVAPRHAVGRHRAPARQNAVTANRQSAGSTEVAHPASETVAAQPAGGQAQQVGGSSSPSPPSSAGGQSVGHTATATSQPRSSPPTGPTGRHALLGPGVCGGCK